MTIVYTSRVGCRRPDAMDITIKSAKNEGRLFAPGNWEMVMGHKAGRVSDEAYIKEFYEQIRFRYMIDPYAYLWFLGKESITLCCYCQPGKFCHRHLAVDILEKIAKEKGLPFERGGEVPK